ncbi:uncharacterized protein [Onthophagus taurus]|uniref:uncharacterized protein n=1 Tax=Onthophagus taurus TaxID=166361 RepID=UPI0039BDE02B
MAIPAEEMLAVTLRYLSTGCTLTELHYNYNIVYIEIWNALRTIHLKELTQEDWKHVTNEFQRKANFPMCVGAIDRKHIRIENFPHAGSMNFNYKKFYSVVLLAIADTDYNFLFVDIGAYGKDCDSSILLKY